MEDSFEQITAYEYFDNILVSIKKHVFIKAMFCDNKQDLSPNVRRKFKGGPYKVCGGVVHTNSEGSYCYLIVDKTKTLYLHHRFGISAADT